jgi:hypothetical protein
MIKKCKNNLRFPNFIIKNLKQFSNQWNTSKFRKKIHKNLNKKNSNQLNNNNLYIIILYYIILVSLGILVLQNPSNWRCICVKIR